MYMYRQNNVQRGYQHVSNSKKTCSAIGIDLVEGTVHSVPCLDSRAVYLVTSKSTLPWDGYTKTQEMENKNVETMHAEAQM